MIDSIIKILNKLNNNIEKYNVVCTYYKEELQNRLIYIPCSVIAGMQYTNNDVTYYIYIDETGVRISNDKGSKVTFEYDNEINKLEISKLAAIIYKNCLDNLTEQIKMFADEEIN